MGHDMKASARFISAGLAISSRTKNIRREVVIDVCRYLARLNIMDRFFQTVSHVFDNNSTTDYLLVHQLFIKLNCLIPLIMCI